MVKLWLFGLFSGDKGDNIDMWMIKIMIKANQNYVDILLISKVDDIKKPAFSISLLVCEFYPHGQKLTGTYPPLLNPCIRNLYSTLETSLKVSTVTISFNKCKSDKRS